LARKTLTLSPDGQQEVFVRRDANGVAQLHVRNVNSERSRQITAFTRDSYDPAWSPTGEWIAFVSSNPGNDEIYRVTPDGSIVERLTYNNWEWDKHPTWSPDGKQIVFFSNREVGRTQLWIMNADGSNQRRLLVSEFDDMYPVWTR
jgi:TolB protein